MAEYIGVSTIVTTEEKDGQIVVALSDGSFEYLTASQLEAVKSETAYPDGEISLRKWKPTISAVLQLLLEANMQMNDKDWLVQRIDESLTENFRTAVAKKFGVNSMLNISTKQIDEILKA